MLGEFWVEVGFGGLPIFGHLHEDGRDQTQATGLVGKNGGNASSASDGFVESLAEDGSSQAFTHGLWEGEDGKAFGEVGFHLGAELGSGGSVFGDDGSELITSWALRLAGED